MLILMSPFTQKWHHILVALKHLEVTYKNVQKDNLNNEHIFVIKWKIYFLQQDYFA